MANPMDLLAAVAKGGSKKKVGKKSTTPILTITDKHTDDVDGYNDALEALKDAKERKKNAEADIALAEQSIIPAASKARREHLQDTGSFSTTVQVGDGVKMVHTKKHSVIPTDNEEELREVFGDDGYEAFFTTHTAIKFHDEMATNPTILQKIINAVGAEEFGKVFDVNQTIVLKGYDSKEPPLVRGRDCDAKIAEKYDEAVDAGLLKPTKASFRT